ncbi:hypothetical protein WN55_08423 [Dufourea novaeangliae]|uniref:Uncharacterized protein n=1 Tax=Dufourea novaeangliae TaxID=178035 RepID=A0A154P734_DUFNO|nr:hypothetical protein WN55_08423 [Dufourea novaeangliae]
MPARDSESVRCPLEKGTIGSSGKKRKAQVGDSERSNEKGRVQKGRSNGWGDIETHVVGHVCPRGIATSRGRYRADRLPSTSLYPVAAQTDQKQSNRNGDRNVSESAIQPRATSVYVAVGLEEKPQQLGRHRHGEKLRVLAMAGPWSGLNQVAETNQRISTDPNKNIHTRLKTKILELTSYCTSPRTRAFHDANSNELIPKVSSTRFLAGLSPPSKSSKRLEFIGGAIPTPRRVEAVEDKGTKQPEPPPGPWYQSLNTITKQIPKKLIDTNNQMTQQIYPQVQPTKRGLQKQLRSRVPAEACSSSVGKMTRDAHVTE